MEHPFHDRRHAGSVLAEKLIAYRDRPGVLVLALPRGGVPVAFEVAQALTAPLDIFLVRKLGVPGHRELALGAVASGGVRVLNTDIVESLDIPPETIEQIARQELRELERREKQYRGDQPPLPLVHQTLIVVDDGLATGASMRAAVEALRHQHAAAIIVAVPVASPETCAEFRPLADDVVCAITPARFRAVGQWYDDFPQTSDQEVRDLLARARQNIAALHASPIPGETP